MSKWIRNLSSNKREEILDKLHRGFVDVCVGISLVGTTLIGYKVYEYYRYLRPIRKAIRERAEQELLAVGQPLEPLEVPSTEELSN